MSDDSSGPLGLPPTVWVVLIVGLAGAFAVSQHPFQDVRPGESGVPVYRHAPSQSQDIEARQWEDPFSAVAIGRRNIDPAKSPSATVSNTLPHDVRRLVADREAHSESGILVLGAMVPGAPYADDIEKRRRTRYAILAGLFQESYVPDDAEHIGFIELSKKEAGQAHGIAAYEWLHLESPAPAPHPPHILLMWLDQDGFQDKPLALFSSLVNSIAEGAPGAKTYTAIVGPADSGGLQVMSKELDDKSASTCQFLGAKQRDLSIYSPRATALNWLIVSDTVKSGYPDNEKDTHNDYPDHFHDRCSHVTLYRTVASDFTVVRAVYKELKYRGVRKLSEIALVTERDTLYARLMGRYFNGCSGTTAVTDRFTVTRFGEEPDGDTSQPLCFTYLKGLDGLVPPTPDSGDTANASSDTKGGAAAGDAPPPVAQESAIGQGQLDYLRRLTTALAASRDDPACTRVARILGRHDPSEVNDNRCGHRIKAIGVVGSDIYDKLLVLQALRRAFPRYIFFTTDLDARLTDAQNLPWTREMVIGSSLGLSLRPELQGSVPPFRDSYQTATYYSTMQAVQRFLSETAPPDPKLAPANTDIELSWTRHPHVFEIGRTQAFDLSANKHPGSACLMPGECPSIAAWRQFPLWSTGSLFSYLSFSLVVILTAIFMAGTAMGRTWTADICARRPSERSLAVTPRNRLLVALLALAVAVGVADVAWSSLVGALTDGGNRVPTPIFSGANHWTASIVEALSILLVIAFVVRGQRKLSTNAATMLKEFHFQLDVKTMADKYRDWLRMPNNSRRWKERLWFPTRALSGNKKHRLVVPATAAERSPPSPLDDLSELEALIGQYLYRGRWDARFIRVAISTVVSSCVLLALEYALMLFEFNLGVSLVNGFAFIDFHNAERGTENFISFVNLLAIQFLIFWVADALLLTRSFMLALAKDKPHWPDAVLQAHAKQFALCKPSTAMWLNLRLIAWRTGRVSSLIWYPSLMLAAMAVAALTVEFGELGFASNPIALVISAGFIVGAAVMLRRAAEAWRSDVIFRLDDGRLSALGNSDAKPGADQLDRLVKRVRSLSEGAFAPYSQQPLVRAVLVPAITYGATLGLQYLHIGS
jgi:hypothetical protein